MNGTRDPKADFLTIYKDIRRPGADKLLAWLASTDFFTAPAGAKHHGAHAGGLVVHSLNVWSRLREITLRDTIDGKAILDLTPETNETVAILGLLHDVCKAGVYHAETKRRRNPETGVWEDYLGYTFRDPLPLGHGEKSLYQIARFIRLEDQKPWQSAGTWEPMTRRHTQTCGTCPQPWTQRHGCGGCMRLICAPPILTKGARTNDKAVM